MKSHKYKLPSKHSNTFIIFNVKLWSSCSTSGRISTSEKEEVERKLNILSSTIHYDTSFEIKWLIYIVYDIKQRYMILLAGKSNRFWWVKINRIFQRVSLNVAPHNVSCCADVRWVLRNAKTVSRHLFSGRLNASFDCSCSFSPSLWNHKMFALYSLQSRQLHCGDLPAVAFKWFQMFF